MPTASIPKNIFMIWIGDSVPNYVEHSMFAYRKANPSFDVTIFTDNISSPKNATVRSILDMYNHGTCGDEEVKNVYTREMSSFSGTYAPFRNNVVLTVSHVLRVYCVYKFGGIYVDADTFPVKPFDDLVLERPFQAYHDNFWFGGRVGDIITNNDESFQSDIGKCIRTAFERIDGYESYMNDRFYRLKRRFIDCELEYGDSVLENYTGNDYYIDHFLCRSWER